MSSRPPRHVLFTLLACSFAPWGKMQPKILLPDFPCQEVAREAVLFAFDRDAFPYQSRLQTFLTSGKFHSVVLPHGPPGAHDEFVRFYGTVIRINDTFHLWYYGQSGPEPDANGYGHGAHAGKALCYATSADGIHWTKPSLGLVEFNGSKANNIVDLGDPGAVVSAAILYDPEDANPDRRFKLVYEAARGAARPSPCVAFSPDGLRWKPQREPIGEFLEMAGITKFRGKYYVNGQFPGNGYLRRKLVTQVSADFEHWSLPAEGLNRSEDFTVPYLNNDSRESSNREEVHLGAALWNRGNVLLGIYGQWHGSLNGDRRLVTMDLGLTVTHDAIHHYEPIPGFKLIPSREQPGSPAFDPPALMQGQGMENVGEKTYYWYSLWKGNAATGVRLVTWERDRIGALRAHYPGAANTATGGHYVCEAVSTSFRLGGTDLGKVFVNASGLNPSTVLRVSLLNASFQPIAGYSALLEKSGLRLPIDWEGGGAVTRELGEVHVRVRFEGARPEDASLHAIYLEAQGR